MDEATKAQPRPQSNTIGSSVPSNDVGVRLEREAEYLRRQQQAACCAPGNILATAKLIVKEVEQTAKREMQVSPEGFLIASEVVLALAPDRAKSMTAMSSTSKKTNILATDSTGNNAQAVAADILSWIRKGKEKQVRTSLEKQERPGWEV